MTHTPKVTACKRLQERLAELVDGGLEPLEEAHARGHLEACQNCASAYAEWLAFHAQLTATLSPAELPIGPVPNINAKLLAVHIAKPKSERRAGVWTSLLAAAASLVALFGFEALGAAMDSDLQAPLFAPKGFEVPARWAGEAGLFSKDLTDGIFTELMNELPDSTEASQ